MTADVEAANENAGIDQWATALWRLLAPAALAGPLLLLAGALCVSFGISRLPGDLDWISQPEGLFLFIAIPFLIASWTLVGRRIATRAPRTGIAVTLLGVIGTCAFSLTTVMRLFTSDLVLHGFDPTALNDVWDGDARVYTYMAFGLSTYGFLAAIIAGIAILKTKAAPLWAAGGFILFPLTMVTAQGTYTVTRITYPLAAIFLLAGVVGATRPGRRPPTAS